MLQVGTIINNNKSVLKFGVVRVLERHIINVWKEHSFFQTNQFLNVFLCSLNEQWLFQYNLFK